MKIKRMVLIAEMAKNNVTLIELSEKSKVSRATISAVRNGKTCNYDTAVKLAAALGISVENIIETEV